MFRKIVRYTLLVSGVLLLLLGGLLVYLLSSKEQIRKFALEQINNQLVSTVNVQEIDLALFRKFPLVSLDMKEVRISEPGAPKKELLSAQHVYVSFNLFDILLNKYRIREVLLDSGRCDILRNRKGELNCLIFKSSDTTSENSLLNLDAVHLERFTVTYEDLGNRFVEHSHVHQLNVSLGLNNAVVVLKGTGNLFIHKIRSGKTTWVENREIQLESGIEIDNSKKQVAFKPVFVQVNGLKLKSAGLMNYGLNPYIDLSFDAGNSTITGLLALVPVTLPASLSTYKSDGDIVLKGTLKGPLSGNLEPDMDIRFSVKNGTLKEPVSGHTIRDILCEGSFNTGKTHRISAGEFRIDRFALKLDNGEAHGRLRVFRLSNPEIELQCEGKLPVGPLLAFQPEGRIKTASGDLSFKLDIAGSVNRLRSGGALEQVNTGDLVVQARTIEFRNGLLIDALDADCNLHSGMLQINNLQVTAKDNDLQLNGTIRNLTGYLFHNDVLEANLALHSSKMDLEKLVFPADASGKDTASFRLPQKIRIDFRFDIGSLSYRLFRASSLNGNLVLQPNKIDLREFSATAMNGRLQLNAQLEPAPNGSFLVGARAVFNEIDIRELFRQCADFGQQEITQQHVNGKLNGSVDLVSVWNRQLEHQSEKLFVNSDISISNGELNGYKPLESLSGYARIEDLRNLRFTELRNKIQISRRTIYVPEMFAGNNALNITLSGTHNFDNFIDYKLKLRLKELLVKKRTPKENEYGEEDESGKGLYLYLSMKGPADNPKISYDKVAVKQKIGQDLVKEKNNIRDLLRKELGIGKDTLIREKQNNSEEVEFEKD